ncbi:oxidoreductase [Stakelama saccharophila]|uniref:Oxidoreductase n=1 Tax=Stakelama saccharophila TaxID=3075605 RepID=A0ABZ0BAC7_9SPHN|nr:oxidoreductase [Stakelama sp. W311]WNO54366.1 oxidoreductase [Stakelama sp. W311]
MDNEPSVPVGLIGFGLAGGVLHAPVIDAVDGLHVAAVATSRAESVRTRFPDARVVAEAGAVFGDPGVALVVIATPNQTHAPLARAGLEAGKHVVVDKPFALDAAEAEMLVELARERERMLSVFHNRRWDGDFLTVRRLLRSGALGRVRLAQFCWDRFRPAVKQGWREEAGPGSGVFADLGPHLIDQAACLFGWPEAVSADILTQRGEACTDDYFDVTLHYGTTRVLLSAGTLVAAARPRFALHGDRASFVKYGLDPQEGVLRAGGRPTDPGFGEEAPAAYGALTGGDGVARPVATDRGDWRRFYLGVRDAVRAGAAPPVDPRDAVRALRLMARARESAREGCVLPFT